LGTLPAEEEFWCNHLRFKQKYIITNTTAVQSSNTKTCGNFCAMFAIYRHYNHDMTFQETANNLFSLDINENEKLVEKFVKNLETKK
jgi:hypothetical protein